MSSPQLISEILNELRLRIHALQFVQFASRVIQESSIRIEYRTHQVGGRQIPQP